MATPEDEGWGVGDVCKAEVDHAYTAENDEEISLEVADIIAVEFKSEASGWWVGTNTRTGEAGMFPGDFVTEIEWDDADNEVEGYNDELLRLADALEVFEGGSGDSNAIFIDNLMAEVAVTLQLALNGGFCDLDSSTGDQVFRFFVQQIMAAVVMRSEMDTEGLALLSGNVVAGMFTEGIAQCVDHLEIAKQAVRELLGSGTEVAIVAMLLQSAFARAVPDTEVLVRVGEAQLPNFRKAERAIKQASDAYVAQTNVKSQYSTLVQTLKSSDNAYGTRKSSGWTDSVKEAVKGKLMLAKTLGGAAWSALTAKAKGISLSRKSSQAPSPTAATAASARRTSVKKHMATGASKAYQAAVIATLRLRTHTEAFAKRRRWIGITEKELVDKAKAKPKRPPPPRPPPPHATTA